MIQAMDTSNKSLSPRQALIRSGVRNLKEFGYPGCDEENILTDMIYSAFFDRMLADHHGHKEAVAELRAEIAKNSK